MTEREVVAKIIETMLEHDIVPVFIEAEATAEGWEIQGAEMSGIISDYRPEFSGAAFRDGSFTIKSGAFGRLTDEGLDVFDNLNPPYAGAKGDIDVIRIDGTEKA